MPDEVAMFIDLENLRYGMLNVHGQEPDFQQLVEKARKYGRPALMRAYADFNEHPDSVNRQLQVAGIEAINIPVKRTKITRRGQEEERVKNAADMVLALDAVITALEADKNREVKTFLLVVGDRDYMRLVTLLRNRLGQRVVIAGVPGTTSRDLVAAAGQEDPVDVPAHVAADMNSVKRAMTRMVKEGSEKLRFWTRKLIDQWSQDPRNNVPGTAQQRRQALSELLNEQVLTIREIDYNNRRIPAVTLDEARARELGYLE